MGKKATQGIVLMALGNSIYGQMAFNLALSLKVNLRSSQGDYPIVLFKNDTAINTLSPSHLTVFDAVADLSSEYYVYSDKIQYFRAKSRIYDFTPFDKTLWLDVDSLINFGKGDDIKRMFSNKEIGDYCALTYNLIDCNTKAKLAESKFVPALWSDLSPELVAFYELKDKKLAQINSSWLYFEKNERIAEYFDVAKKLWEGDKKVNTFRGDYPDEFFFHIAGAKTGVYNKQIPFVPLYGDHEYRAAYGNDWIGEKRIMNEFTGLMMYGLHCPNHIQSLYNMQVEQYMQYNRMGKLRPFFHINKSKVGIND